MSNRVAVHIGDLVREAATLCDENKKFQELLSKDYDTPSRLYVELDDENVRIEIQPEITDKILRMLLNSNNVQLATLRARIITLYDDMTRGAEKEKHDVELVECDEDEEPKPTEWEENM